MADLRIGTCSWKYDSWQGLVYGDHDSANYLQAYARKYSSVEIDQWFWSLHGVDKVTLPKHDVVETYRQSIPNDFRFTIKMPNSLTLTHLYRKDRKGPLVENPHFLSPDLLDAFLNSIDPLLPFLGPLMFQFEYLNKQKMANQTDFLSRLEPFLKVLPNGYKFGIEIRNPNFISHAYFDLLNTYNIAHIFLQGYFMPPIVDVYRKHQAAILGSTVLRLHGPDRQGMEKRAGGKWDTIQIARDKDLNDISEMIESLITSKVDVWLNVNNHFEGSAPRTIERIRDLLDDRGIMAIPPNSQESV